MAQGEAAKLDPDAQLGDAIGVKVESARFGRIAAQSSKQIIVQKVRDAERSLIYEEFKDRVGEILGGNVKRFERNDVIVELGATEAVIPGREQIPTEKYRIKDRIQGYVLEVKRSARGPQIIMSRAHPGFLIKLFEQSVTEIYDGIVTIESAARDPGFRAKIAVHSRDSSVDPVGACVGMKGARVQAVVAELNGEKVDIVPWDQDPARLVCNALAPAQVSKVIVDDAAHTMEVVVAEDQLSLAIGKRGQNVRLAAQLTGWRLDIKSESRLREEMSGTKDLIASIEGVGSMRAEILVNEGVKSLAEFCELSPRTLVRFLNMDDAEAQIALDSAKILKEKFEAGSTPAVANVTVENEVFANGLVEPRSEGATSGRDSKSDRVGLFLELGGIGEATAQALVDAGYGTIGDLMADSVEEVAQKSGLSIGIARTVQMAADRYLQGSN